MVSYSELINIKFLLFLELFKPGLGFGLDRVPSIRKGHEPRVASNMLDSQKYTIL